MSGRKQHYIPQALLKAFSASPDAKAPPIFVYTKERGFYKTNTKDTAAEREFYSPLETEGVSLDDDITTYENQLTEQLSAVKNSQDTRIDSTLAGSIVVHLALRNDHTRKTFGQAGAAVLGAVGTMFTDTTAVRSMMGFDLPFAESEAKQQIRKTIQQKFPRLSAQQRALLEAQALAAMARGFDQFYEQKKPFVAGVAKKMEQEIGGMAKGGHVKALSKSLAPEQRIASLAKLHWQILPGEFLLPDCVAIAFDATERATPYILSDKDNLHSVFMPVSRTQGLLGSMTENFSAQTFNALAAACSTDFFVAANSNDDLKALMTTIGTRTSEDVERLTDEAIQSSRYTKKT